jgi:chemotaxis protein CheD
VKHRPDLQGLAARVAARTQAARSHGAAVAARFAPPPITGWRTARPGEALSLMPGELWFGTEAASVKTLLGSCVAVTLWHPRRRVGGMCHYLLPHRQRKGGEPLDGRYGDEAVLAMVNLLERHGCKSGELVAHLYGGADTLSDCAGIRLNVGERNIDQGWKLVDHFAFTLEGVDVGDNVPRTVTLHLDSGAVECRRGKAQ